ncbi:GDSL-type esterase/lipase family protein [Bacteroides sp. 51]|uniref:GDSL-type esterase/lipase family protein n=1 Tax=Bacteroides sp. 51 TaxID=2302938 RepID=UPI0013D657DE|nr:GDSL-type esterase/lipase family protein [Bacteroides sp. 51]NDV82524.1 hypothetical protein [Bacteroides sp. 51]
MKQIIYGVILLLLSACSPVKTKVVCIGASITEGAGVQNRQEFSFPGQLQTLLGSDYEVENYGIGGTTMLSNGNSPYKNTEAYQKALHSKPDIVFIDLGGNDAKAINRPYYANLEEDARQMIRSFKELPTKPRVILMLPTAFFVTDQDGIYDPVSRNEVTPRLREAAYKENVEVLDMYPLLVDRPELVPDQIHPNEEGAAILAQRMYDQLILPLDPSFDIFTTLDSEKIDYSVSNFAGYACADFKMKGRDCKVVKPRNARKDHPWIWRARFWGHEPQTDIALLERGYHLVYCDQSGLVGNDECIANWNAFYNLLHKGGLSQKVVLEGMSRGALYALNWAAVNPDKIAAVYVDNPLLDCRYFGDREPNEVSRDLMKVYNLPDIASIKEFNNSPTDKVPEIVSGGYPILILCADEDEAVPLYTVQEFEKKVRDAGGDITVIVKKGFKHHPHSFPNPQRILDVILL